MDNMDSEYRIWKVPKQNGKTRTIIAPSDSLKEIQSELLAKIPDGLIHDCAHGFRPGRSIYTNARHHTQKRYVLNVDIKNFFPSIKKDTCLSTIASFMESPDLLTAIEENCFFKGMLPQGAPTSPAIANLYLRNFDLILSEICETHSIRYTRYADDLTFSGGSWLKANFGSFLKSIDNLLSDFSLYRNRGKTKLMPYYQRQVVTGLLVNGEKPRLSKKRRVKAYARLFGRNYTDLSFSDLGFLNFVRDTDLRAYNRICQTLTGKKEEERIMAMPEYISRIKFFKTSGNGAFEGSGTFTVADSIAVKFTIFSNNGKMRVVLPSEKNDRFDPGQPVGKQNPKFYDQVYPISLEARTELETTLINNLIAEREKLGGNTYDQTIPF